MGPAESQEDLTLRVEQLTAELEAKERELNQLDHEGRQPLARPRSGIMKLVVAAAIPFITAVGSWISTGTLNLPEVWLAITGVVTALVVSIVPAQFGAFASGKTVAAAITPLVSALTLAVTGSFSKPVLTTAVVGLLTAVLMHFVQPASGSYQGYAFFCSASMATYLAMRFARVSGLLAS
jgi:hypothetical protein